MKFEEIKEIINEFSNSELSELNLEKGDFLLKLKKESGNNASCDKIEKTKNDNSEENFKKNNPAFEEEKDVYVVRSPLIGVYYAAPAPDAPPFVKVGDKVYPDTSLCIIEAMKIMNEIEAEFEGEIAEILVKNEQVVELGQPIMKIRRK